MILPLEKRLREHVNVLAGEIGERNVYKAEHYHRAAQYIKNIWLQLGLEVRTQQFRGEGVNCENIFVEIGGTGRPEEIIMAGAHYDSVFGSPGANDNASGVAAILEMARSLFNSRPNRTIRFVAFANEEPPFFMTNEMGSLLFARECASRRERIRAMLSVETIGYFTDSPNSQSYPPFFKFFYPSVGNFIGVASNLRSKNLLERIVKHFKSESEFPLQSLAAPTFVPGIDWSDQASFWEFGYPAVMITDTAPYRYPHYHLASDLPEELNYRGLSEVTRALAGVVLRLSNE